MTAAEYISAQAPERQQLLQELHEIIIAQDQTVSPVVEKMMGKEMIIYKERCYMKYALSSVKNYISFHCMPIYGGSPLHAKYVSLLPGAAFQKGCINFTSAEQLPLTVFRDLVNDCERVSIAAMLEAWKKKKK